MSIVEKLRGAMSAIITPFTDDGRVDVAALSKLVDAQIEGGIDGLVACGTTGETPTLTVEEQELVVRTVIEAAGGRVPIIAGSGSNDTAATVAMTERVKSWGADAALVVAPYYNKPSQEGIYRHFQAVAQDGGLPVVAYNVPGRTVTDMMPETIARLQSDGHIIAVKDATANMVRATDTLAQLDPDKPFAMLSGDDFTILPFIALGGVGVISVVSNICPGDTSRLVQLTKDGAFAEARPLNTRIVQLTRALFCAPNPVPLKKALAMAGWCTPVARLPLVTGDDAVGVAVNSALQTYSGKEDFAGFMS